MSTDLRAVGRTVLRAVEGASHPPSTATTRLLVQRLFAPVAWVAVVGETSTGKSTLINALLEDMVLPAAARPTTGTVVQLILRDQEDQFLAITRAATQRALERDAFEAQAMQPGPDLLRLQLRTGRAGRDFDGLQVFDTPGYNSVVAEHEAVLRDVLPESDLVVFVAGFRTGFGQDDQDLYELTRVSVPHDAPVLLAVNRVPPGTDTRHKRVQSIVQNAEDSIGRSLELFLIESAPGNLPDASALWKAVRRHALDPERLAALERRILLALTSTAREARSALERRRDALGLTPSEREELEATLTDLQRGKEDCYDAIDRRMDRLRSLLPGAVRAHTGQLAEDVRAVVDESNKWLGQADCIEYLQHATFPQGARRACRALEEMILTELDALNDELDEIANTTVGRIQRRMKVQSNTAQRLTAGLSAALVKRLGGDAILAGLRGLGGVGGAAAGAGNLVKMLVSRGGRLFGKTFSREVYYQIARMFNKRMLQTLGGIATVLFEGILFIREANRWQADLGRRCDMACEEWAKAVQANLIEEQLPKLRDANRASVDLVFDDLIDEARAAVAPTVPEEAADLDEKVAALDEAIAELEVHT